MTDSFVVVFRLEIENPEIFPEILKIFRTYLEIFPEFPEIFLDHPPPRKYYMNISEKFPKFPDIFPGLQSLALRDNNRKVKVTL